MWLRSLSCEREKNVLPVGGHKGSKVLRDLPASVRAHEWKEWQKKKKILKMEGKMGRNKGRLSDFLDPIDLWPIHRDHRPIWLQTCTILQDKRRMTPESNLEFIGATSSVSAGKMVVTWNLIHTQQSSRGKTSALGVWKTEHWTKENYSWALRFDNIYFLGTHHLVLLIYFSLLDWECLSHVCPTIVFWKYLTYLILHVQAGDEFCFRWIIPWVLSISDLDNIYILDFKL